MAGERTYSRIAGHVVLDLINTVSWRLDDAERTDDLEQYEDVLDWAAQAGILTESERRTLRRQAKENPAAAGRELTRFRRLRECAYVTLVEGSDTAAEELQRRHQAGMERSRLVNDNGRWTWSADPLAMATVADRVVRETIGLLTSPQLGLLHQCEDVACGWVYLDTSPRRNRRWCVAEDCGNRNRARRFYARQKAKR